ncbi:hypothetical protein [Thermotoga sp. KOL6]|uniref:hypothetical protein n=1 Tax=Thermotoga sp. KOL6 TaxID=126741 RepID=UPI000C78ED57|nr:hypothetical protein [Thermotoga sp. KOL6]PLV60315.1 hypothetical protein AS005_03240 [Thermotoga sp. KOL6]
MENVIGGFLKVVIDNWYFSLPAALFLMFASRYVENIAFAVLGFILGINFVFPFLASLEALKEYLSNENVKMVVMVAVGVLTAVVIYVLYKYLVFLAAFVTISFLAYYVINFMTNSFGIQNVQYMNWITLGLSAFVGMLAGLTAYRRERDFAKILSILVGAAVFSALVLWYLSGLFNVEFNPENFFENKSMVFFYVSLFLLFLFIAAWFTFRKVSSPKTER